MANDPMVALTQFETRVRQLILEFQALKKDNEELYAMLEKKEETIKALQNENEEIKEQYAKLKLAKMIEISDNDVKNAKLRLSKLVRDVDKCIALLNL